MKTTSPVLGTLLLLIVILASLGAAIVYSGTYNIAATNSHSKFVSSILETTMEHSVKNHARSIAVPATAHLRDPGFAERSVGDYNEMCLTCHGAPGRKPDPWTAGLHPKPPSLTEAEHMGHWTDAEVYWIIRNGIKDTGMMAFGPSHEDEELWALTALVRQFPALTADQYRAMTERAEAKEHFGSQHHAEAGGEDHAHHE